MMRKPFALLMITLLAFAIVPMPVIAGGGPNVDVQMPAISPPDPAQSSDDHTYGGEKRQWPWGPLLFDFWIFVFNWWRDIRF
jgi:hypothetical protein